MAHVAVVLPFKNAATTLGGAARSVVSEPGAELIAVDDGSTDGSARALPRGARVVSANGRGLVAALQTGIAATNAPFIARMDADDVSRPGRIARAIAMLEADPSLGAVATQVVATGPAGPGLLRYIEWQNRLLTPTEHACARFIESPVCHPSVVLRRRALEAVGGYRDVEWAEDYDLWLRLMASGYGIAKVPEVLFEWRHRPDRLTFVDPRYRPERFTAARAHYLAPLLTDRNVVLWGAGKTGRLLARALEPHGIRPTRFIDIDPKKLGRRARGVAIESESALECGRDTVVVAVGAAGARALIQAALVARGFSEGTNFFCAA